MTSPTASHDPCLIRAQVLRGLARNRIPGLHFPGHFLALEVRKFSREAVTFALPAGPHVASPDGRAGLSALAMLVDVTLASAIRPFLAPGAQTATVSMHINFSGLAPIGDLICEANCLGFSQGAVLPQAVCRGIATSAAGVVCYCSGTFVQLDTASDGKQIPIAWETETPAQAAHVDESQLSVTERKVLRHADACLAALAPGASFVDRFWGGEVTPGEGKARSRLALGAHTGNRLGFTQGGLMVAYAARTAAAAVARHGVLEGVSAWFIRPGVGARIRAQSEILQNGRNLAVVRTQVFGSGRKRVLEVVSNHAAAESDDNKRAPA